MEEKPSESHNIKLGKLGEDIAADYLVSKGYTIFERNWRNHHKEIDIIAFDGKMLVIVEVKTRQTDDFGTLDPNVDRRKQRLLIAAANAYIFRHNIDYETRFDIITIILKENQELVIEHLEDAFYPM